MAKKRQKPLELKVVFDTNAIFTDSAAFLVKREVSEIIRANSSHRDLQIRWYLPEVVRWEREFQMRENGFSLLPSVAKIEKVLKHNLNITEQTINERVPSLVNEQLKDLGIEIISFDSDNIDWPRIVRDAAARNAPFERGEKEKGFRDAVILESFVQLVQRSPKTPSSCLVVLVARDELLTRAVKDRIEGAKNIRLVEDVTALQGLINTLASQVTEEFVQSVRTKAADYFFTYEEAPKTSTGLLIRENVLQRIQSELKSKFSLIPAGYEGKDWVSTKVTDTRFSKKEGSRIFWETRIYYEYKPYRWKEATPVQPYITGFGGQNPIGATSLEDAFATSPGFSGFSAYQSILGAQGPTGPLGQNPSSAPKEKRFGENGRIVVDVTWSVVISTQRQNFSGARIESINHVETA